MANMAKLSQMEKMLPAFTAALAEVFSTMVNLPITIGPDAPKTHGAPMGRISGTIGLTGDEVVGSLSLIFERDTAFAIFRAMMMMDETAEVNDGELNDVVGELCNMVAGGAKCRLQEDASVRFKIGLPTVTVGDNLFVEPPKNVLTQVVDSDLAAGKIYLQLSI